MYYCKLCNLVVEIDNKFQLIEILSQDYICDKSKPDIKISVSDEELSNERTLYPQFNDAYLEGQLIFKKLVLEVIPYNIFFLHCAAVEYKGEAYIFTGRSGVGKSTHAALWKKVFPNSQVINGDKPLIKKEKDGFYVYGTPWAGKEGMQKNTSAKIKRIYFVEQADDNSVTALSSSEVLGKIFNQTVYVKEKELNKILMDNLSEFISSYPFYLLKCNMNDDAVLCAYYLK